MEQVRASLLGSDSVEVAGALKKKLSHKFHTTFTHLSLQTSSFFEVPQKRAPAKMGSVQVVLLPQYGFNPCSGMLRNYWGCFYTGVSLLIK